MFGILSFLGWVICCLGSIAFIFSFPCVAPAPASLGLLARVGYYIFHRGISKLFLCLAVTQVVVKGLECIEERKWPCISLGDFFLVIIVMWLSSAGLAELEADYHGEYWHGLQGEL